MAEKLLEMAKNGWECLKWFEMAGNGLEGLEHARSGWKWME